jgi:GNAT superfamily N-acetyltransferase
MNQLHSRPYQKDTDLDLVRKLVGCNGVRPNIMDIGEKLELPEIQENCRVWLDINRNIIAVALVDDYQNLCFDSIEDSSIPGLLEEILPWALDIAQTKFGEPALDACEYSDSLRLPFLRNMGFFETGLRTFRFAYDLGQSDIKVNLPDGFIIRPLNSGNEIPAWLDLHLAANPGGQLDEEYRYAMMAAPNYSPGLDLVLVSPSGELAAYCVCTPETQFDGSIVGFTDPIAVHPEYQGMRLGNAILLYGILQLQSVTETDCRYKQTKSNTYIYFLFPATCAFFI